MKQVFIALDQLLNTLLWFLPGGCWADETLSSRAWRIRNELPMVRATIDRLFWFEDRHCFNSYLSERERLQLPPEFR